MKVLKTERELLGFLRQLREQEEGAPPPAEAPAAVPAAPTGAPTDAQAHPITVEDIIEKLNVVRSGKSTKDADVKREMSEYVAQFTEEEKLALVAFLEGLGQILTGGIDSEAASDPADPYSLQIQRSSSPTVTKPSIKPPGPAPKAVTPAPTSPAPGPVPIKVGG